MSKELVYITICKFRFFTLHLKIGKGGKVHPSVSKKLKTAAKALERVAATCYLQTGAMSAQCDGMVGKTPSQARKHKGPWS